MPQSPPELAPPTVRRIADADALVAVASALALLAGLAWTQSFPGWVVLAEMAMSAATSVIAGIRIVPTVAAIRRLGKRAKR